MVGVGVVGVETADILVVDVLRIDKEDRREEAIGRVIKLWLSTFTG